jgi:hypothetical protein
LKIKNDAALKDMNIHWIHTVPGSLVIAALLAWPMSKQESETLFERIRFCLLSMLGGALLVWGIQQPPADFHGNMGFLTIDGPVVALMAAGFLVMLWFDKATGMLTDLLLGCIEVPDHSDWDMNYESRQMEQAVQLYRRGRRQRALRLCNRIIQSNSPYTATATTLAFWINNPDRFRLISPPRTTLVFKGKFAGLNRLLTF